MKSKIFIISIIVVCLVVIGGFVFYQNQPRSNSPTINSSGNITPPSSPDDFINNSAKEVADQAGNNVLGSQTTANASGIEFKCTGDKATSFFCYEAYYQTVVSKLGIKAAFNDLKSRYNTTAFVKADCHPLAHVLGNAAVKLYPTVAEAYKHGDSFCWSGYYHGVLEGVVGKLDKATLAKQLPNICDGIEGKANYSFDYYNCVHGLGHGVMAITNNELFESLKLCDNLVGRWEQESCYGGVFMENVIIDNKDHFTKYLKPSEPLYPCSAVDTPYKNTCYLMQTSYMLKVTGQSFPKVFELCSQVEEPFNTTCYQSLGRDASGHTSSNIAGTKAYCYMGKNYQQQSNCVIGAVKDFISYYHSITQAKEFCNSLTSDLQGICTSTAEQYYTTF